jgi:hypothetical protein
MILQVDPVTGRVLRQFTDTDSGGYDSECNSSAPLDGGGIAVPMHARVGLISGSGMTMTALPGAERGSPLSVTASAAGDLWCVASLSPVDTTMIAPTLYKLARNGPVQVSHPFPQAPSSSGPPGRLEKIPRPVAARFDLLIGSMSAAGDGGLWFAGAVSVWHLG